MESIVYQLQVSVQAGKYTFYKALPYPAPWGAGSTLQDWDYIQRRFRSLTGLIEICKIENRWVMGSFSYSCPEIKRIMYMILYTYNLYKHNVSYTVHQSVHGIFHINSLQYGLLVVNFPKRLN